MPTATFSRDGSRIFVTHPINGKILNWGIRKLSAAKRADFLRDIQRLIDAAPKFPADCPTGLDKRVTKPYFNALGMGLDHLYKRAADKNGLIDGIDFYKEPEKARVRYAFMRNQCLTLQAFCSEARQERDELQRRLDELIKRTGERSKHDSEVTLEAGFQQFEKRFRLRKDSPLERSNVMRRVKAVLKELGMKRNFGDLKLSDIEDAITASNPASESEKSKRSSDTKRFFKFVCLPVEANGLGISKDPAALLRYKTPRQLQRLRLRAGLVIAADDPADLLPKMEPYWRTLYAAMCYTGTRASECVSLEWGRVDFAKKTISVLETEDKKELKNERSYRPIKPFKELWEILERYKPVNTSPTQLIFPRPANGKSWFLKSGKVNHVARGLTRALIRAGMPKEKAREPNRRARRYWETRMRSIGRSDLIPIMGGHTHDMMDHYTENITVVEAITGENF